MTVWQTIKPSKTITNNPIFINSTLFQTLEANAATLNMQTTELSVTPGCLTRNKALSGERPAETTTWIFLRIYSQGSQTKSSLSFRQEKQEGSKD